MGRKKSKYKSTNLNDINLNQLAIWFIVIEINKKKYIDK